MYLLATRLRKFAPITTTIIWRNQRTGTYGTLTMKREAIASYSVGISGRARLTSFAFPYGCAFLRERFRSFLSVLTVATNQF